VPTPREAMSPWGGAPASAILSRNLVMAQSRTTGSSAARHQGASATMDLARFALPSIPTLLDVRFLEQGGELADPWLEVSQVKLGEST
jgi:hypothetical protein